MGFKNLQEWLKENTVCQSRNNALKSWMFNGSKSNLYRKVSSHINMVGQPSPCFYFRLTYTTKISAYIHMNKLQNSMYCRDEHWRRKFQILLIILILNIPKVSNINFSGITKIIDFIWSISINNLWSKWILVLPLTSSILLIYHENNASFTVAYSWISKQLNQGFI